MASWDAGKAVGYMALPGIIPRVRSLFFSGFGIIAYLVALTYSLVRLLPRHHPYLDARNIGKYGIRHVLAAALHDLDFKWKNIDQILVYFAVMAGTVSIAAFIAATLFFLLVSPVYALSFMITPSPESDLAFIMLDKVFGIPGVFNSEVTTNTAKYGPFPNNFQAGLVSLFQFFSMGLFLLSVFIFLYYIVVAVAETAITGTPFGERFTNFWLPIRLVGALALLMPAFSGLNTAQYIVLYAAKYGSGLATNTWVSYNVYSGGENPIGTDNKELITRPSIPDYSQLIKDLILIRGCMEMQLINAIFLSPLATPELFYGSSEWLVKGNMSQPLLDNPLPALDAPPPRSPVAATIDPSSPWPWTLTYDNLTTFNKALNFYGGSDMANGFSNSRVGSIRLVLGTFSRDVYGQYEGMIYPHCGEITIPITSQSPEALYVAEGYLATVIRILYSIGRSTAPNQPGDNLSELGLGIASARPFYQTSTSWRTVLKMDAANRIPSEECYFDSDNDMIDEFPQGGTALPNLGNCHDPVPTTYWSDVIERFQKSFEWAALAGYDYLTGEVTGEDMNFSIGDTYYQSLGQANPLAMNTDILRYGWGGAGLWYNKIAELNGSLTAAIGATPIVSKYPDAMERIKEQRLKNDSSVDTSPCEMYNPAKSQGSAIDIPESRTAFFAESALALYTLCKQIHGNELIRPVRDDGFGNTVSYARTDATSNPVLNVINAMFGANTFFNILENRETNPMSMLVTLGRTLIDKAIFNFTAATGVSVIGGLNQLGPGQDNPGFAHLTLALQQLSKVFVTIASMALVSGFILFYILPLMPFLYFFFAVGTWVKTIFEAMVAVPLWALAHLSLAGPGLVSPMANIGYYMILEIFIRPVLTVFSLVASFSIFTALVIVLNTTFDLVLSNIFGADMKPAIDAANGVALPSEVEKLSNMMGLMDQFIFTLFYILIVYMIGMSCFKLIDLIPENIMRWSGVGVRTWGGITLYGGGDSSGVLVQQLPERLGRRAMGVVQEVSPIFTAAGDVAAEDAVAVIRGGAQQARRSPAQQAIDDLNQEARSGNPSKPVSNSVANSSATEAPTGAGPQPAAAAPGKPADRRDPLTGEPKPSQDPVKQKTPPTGPNSTPPKKGPGK